MMPPKSIPLLLIAVTLLAVQVERGSAAVHHAQSMTGGADSAAIDPEAFSASTPLPGRKLEGVFAGFILHVLVGGIAEEYLGGINAAKEVAQEKKIQLVEEIYGKVGEIFTTECKAMGLPPPRNASNIPVAGELVQPTYFSAYSYAVFRVAVDLSRSKDAFQRYHDRIGGRLFDAISQYVQFQPSHDMEDIKSMRKSLAKFLDQYGKLGMAEKAGALFPKGIDKKWEAGEGVKFKTYVDTPVMLTVGKRLDRDVGGFKDWSYFIVQRLFTSFLVDAQLVKEYPAEDNPTKFIQEWVIEQM